MLKPTNEIDSDLNLCILEGQGMTNKRHICHFTLSISICVKVNGEDLQRLGKTIQISRIKRSGNLVFFYFIKVQEVWTYTEHETYKSNITSLRPWIKGTVLIVGTWERMFSAKRNRNSTTWWHISKYQASMQSMKT